MVQQEGSQVQAADGPVASRAGLKTLLQGQNRQFLTHQARQLQRAQQIWRLLRRYRKKGDGHLLRKNYET
jgi:hypothetical protein